MLVGDTVHQVHTHQVNIANGSFHAGCPITADASANDRLLLCYPLGGPHRQLIAASIRQAVARHTLAAPPYLTTGDVWLGTEPPQRLVIDGAAHGHTPVRISLAAQALRVVVPIGFPDT
jgi:diacylglycerol kinase family enzyme